MNKRWLDEIERAIQQLELPSEPSPYTTHFNIQWAWGGSEFVHI